MKRSPSTLITPLPPAFLNSLSLRLGVLCPPQTSSPCFLLAGHAPSFPPSLLSSRLLCPHLLPVNTQGNGNQEEGREEKEEEEGKEEDGGTEGGREG